MKTIYKYTLKLIDDQFLELPLNAEILTVQIQHGNPQLWAIVNTELPKEKRHIRIHGTGHSLSTVDKLKYISTFQMQNGQLVLHVFEVIR